MNFDFSEEHNMLRSTVKDFANNEIRPIARKIDDEECIPKNLINKLGEMGILGTLFPEEYGGGGFGIVGFCVAEEEISRVCGSTATLIGAHQSIGMNAIYIGGSDSLKKKYLPSLASGEKIAAFCLTEPEAGSDAFSLKTEAKLVGNKWIINGSKIWITNGAIADVLSVFARTEKGITGFAIDAKSPGIFVGPNEKKLGIKGSVTNAITFENVEVPKENIIGQDGKGFLIAMHTLDAGRLCIGACCCGAAKEMLEISTDFANHRKQFGEVISHFEGVQFMVAEIATRIYAMESLLYRAAQRYDDKKDIALEAAMVKLFCSEAVAEVADRALQIHGGMGFSRELPVEKFYRDARILKIFEGTSEIQKMIIGRKIAKNNGAWKL